MLSNSNPILKLMSLLLTMSQLARINGWQEPFSTHLGDYYLTHDPIGMSDWGYYIQKLRSKCDINIPSKLKDATYVLIDKVCNSPDISFFGIKGQTVIDPQLNCTIDVSRTHCQNDIDTINGAVIWFTVVGSIIGLGLLCVGLYALSQYCANCCQEPEPRGPARRLLEEKDIELNRTAAMRS